MIIENVVELVDYFKKEEKSQENIEEIVDSEKGEVNERVQKEIE